MCLSPACQGYTAQYFWSKLLEYFRNIWYNYVYTKFGGQYMDKHGSLYVLLMLGNIQGAHWVTVCPPHVRQEMRCPLGLFMSSLCYEIYRVPSGSLYVLPMLTNRWGSHWVTLCPPYVRKYTRSPLGHCVSSPSSKTDEVHTGLLYGLLMLWNIPGAHWVTVCLPQVQKQTRCPLGHFMPSPC